MGGKPDILKAIVLIFAVGLVITGFTSIHASEDKPQVENTVTIGSVQGEAHGLNR
ncbi:hypothetical protein ACFQGA_04900 [Marinobacter koreensis]|jgi:uncharacterized membrane protein|uniref:Uncharacterized protein n=2 Tax=Marinobacter TaxID=2742 RepID=M7CSP9_9GAMM|nr:MULTISPECIES: hypothetical protein [Marinobacter]EMP55170.1 hypothetical protein MSNKSG1_12142 [Marinobacter santoriniensis NKSG1]MCK7547496.1 hypothetical protein [Marinobacter koreensis]MDX1817706.1 hypothetical protein [Marinobacter sp.]